MTIVPFAGRFEGSGRWHDEGGKSQSYTIVQMATPTADGFDLAFKHHFEDGTVVDARFLMVWIDGVLFRVMAGGQPIGHGYRFDAFTHYHLHTASAVVEVGIQSNGDALDVRGSSTKNAEGLFIAWRETLRRS